MRPPASTKTKQKGFINIVEIIIIAIVLFIIVVQFGSVPLPIKDWSRVKLNLQASDALFTLDKMGVNWFDANQVSGNLSALFNDSNVIYNVRLKNVIKPVIFVGCMCTNAESELIETILTPFTINGRQVQFFIDTIDPARPSFPLRYDMIVVFDYDLNPLENEIRAYLAADKGIVQFRDFSQVEVNAVQQNVFGLIWQDSLSPNTNAVDFSSTTSNSSNIFYPIHKYFFHIPRESGGTFTDPHTFNGLDIQSERVNTTGPMDNIILAQRVTAVPAAIVNRNMANGLGRTAWLSRNGDQEDADHMLKSLVVWAAGNEHVIIQNAIPNPVSTSLFKVLNQDMHEPIEVILSLGFLFK